MEKVNVLLPMKGNSERVPNKNLKKFNDFPLYHAIIKVLLKSKLIEGIYVNTDSNDIIEDINDNFPEVNTIIRPFEIQGDHVSMNKIIEHDLSMIDGDYFLQTHSTNPLLTVHTIDNAIRYYFEIKEDYDSVFSVTKWQSRFYWEGGEPINHDPKELVRTQDLKPIFEENSNIYIFSKNSFKKAGNKRIGNNAAMFNVNKIESIDIDEIEDFRVAEIIYGNRNN